jgi:hypothetical protein
MGDLTVLLDEQATRAALLDAMEGLARRASASDLIIVTFAGHGAGLCKRRAFRGGHRGCYGGHLVLVNLAGDGTLQYLFPEGNADNLIDKERLAITFRSQAPFALQLAPIQRGRSDEEW